MNYGNCNIPVIQDINRGELYCIDQATCIDNGNTQTAKISGITETIKGVWKKLTQIVSGLGYMYRQW